MSTCEASATGRSDALRAVRETKSDAAGHSKRCWALTPRATPGAGVGLQTWVLEGRQKQRARGIAATWAPRPCAMLTARGVFQQRIAACQCVADKCTRSAPSSACGRIPYETNWGLPAIRRAKLPSWGPRGEHARTERRSLGTHIAIRRNPWLPKDPGPPPHQGRSDQVAPDHRFRRSVRSARLRLYSAMSMLVMRATPVSIAACTTAAATSTARRSSNGRGMM